ncbi:MAG TPA: hypothetical protein VFI95_09170 [Terriglobales bacterium]|nr:hypothetical protein [Terriglobales bacterium]
MGFEQASIPIEKEREFSELRNTVAKAFAPGQVEKYLATLKSKGVRIRDFESVLAKKALQRAAPELKGIEAQGLYQSLTVSDRAQMREFYLVQVEQVPSELRRKYHQLYQDI